MFHIINPNTLYDVINEHKIELNLYKGKDKHDIAQFLDDVSTWMDSNREMITENYLPFCVLSVGVIPIQVSSFMFGLFVGKGLEKHGLKINSSATRVDKETIFKEIEASMNYYNGLMGENLRDQKEKRDNGRDK